MKKIIFTRPDGGLSVMHPFEGARLCSSITLSDGSVLPTPSEKPEPADTAFGLWPVEGATAQWAETEDEFAARIGKKDAPADAINVTVVDESAIPTDFSYRNAWVAVGQTVVHDMNKAREIHKDKLRAQRAPLLADLDIAYQRADEKGDIALKADIARRKQFLRDITSHPGIAGAKTIEDLKVITV